MAKSKTRQLLWYKMRQSGSIVLSTTMPTRSRMAGNDGTRMVVAILQVNMVPRLLCSLSALIVHGI